MPEASAADERTPLLNGSSPDPEQPRDSASDDVPEVEELSTARLTVILGSAWFGVFLNALGL